jgi:hypothetical protein
MATRARPAAPAKASKRASSRRVTPEQALASTRKLLEAKQAKRHETPPWQAIGEVPHGMPHAGFQSDEARVHATALHNDEMDLPAIQGHVSDQNRQRQGKRDHRSPNRH